MAIPPGAPLCSSDPTVAADRANHACAWLGAGANPFGANEPGACLTQARSVLDCRTAPERPAIGATDTLWRCLVNAGSTADVVSCVEPGGAEACSTDAGAYTACEVPGAGHLNGATRIACNAPSTAATGVESCVASGRTCVEDAGAASCSVGTGACSESSCEGTVLHDCDDAGVDRGLDCASFGTGMCAADPTSGALGCVTLGDACLPSTALTCDDAGVARGCPSGTMETVDCPALTGVAGAGACDPAAPGQPWDVSRACIVDAGTTCKESCTDGVLTACVLGQPVTLDCAKAGLGACSYVTVAGESAPACSPP